MASLERIMRLSFFATTLALSLSPLACGPVESGSASLSLGTDSPGALGKARFDYAASDCPFGCSLDRPVLQGSLITIVASVDQAPADLSATLTGASVGRISGQTPDCSVDLKRCKLYVDIQTTGAGDARLEVSKDRLDLDYIPVRVRPASRIELSVRASATADGDLRDVPPGSDGLYVLKLGELAQLTARVFTSDGQEAMFTRHGVSHAYGNTDVLSVDDRVWIGASDIEYVKTGRPGDTTITVRAPGAETVAKFRVTP